MINSRKMTSTHATSLDFAIFAEGDYFGDISIACPGSPTLHIPWWARISRK